VARDGFQKTHICRRFGSALRPGQRGIVLVPGFEATFSRRGNRAGARLWPAPPRAPKHGCSAARTLAAETSLRQRRRAYPAGNGENLGATCSRSQVCEDGVNAPILCGAGGKVELAQDVTDVRFDRSRRQPEARCDAAVGETFGYQAEHFALPLG
jgi:hypothetical protein